MPVGLGPDDEDDYLAWAWKNLAAGYGQARDALNPPAAAWLSGRDEDPINAPRARGLSAIWEMIRNPDAQYRGDIGGSR